MKTFIVVIGPPAVGKMTVGMELSRQTGFGLLHNHATIELILPIFAFGRPEFFRTLSQIRASIFAEVAASPLPGFITTCVWDFDDPRDRAETEAYCAPFRTHGWAVRFVELAATLEVRLARNRTPLRLEHKPSKRDLAASESRLLRTANRRFNSAEDFPWPEEHMMVANDQRSPEDVVRAVIAHFGLTAAALKSDA